MEMIQKPSLLSRASLATGPKCNPSTQFICTFMAEQLVITTPGAMHKPSSGKSPKIYIYIYDIWHLFRVTYRSLFDRN